MWLSVIFMGLIYGGMISEASLFAQYGCYEPVEKDMGPSKTPASVANVKTELECSVMCSRDDHCLSFYYGKSKCGLFHTLEENMEKMHDHTYYQKCQPKTLTNAAEITTPEPKLCEKCPTGTPKTIYASEDAAHIMCADETDWPTSMEACSCAGGRLVNILDQKDQTYVEDITSDLLANGTSLSEIWIGINGTGHGHNQPYTYQRSNGETLTEKSSHFEKWYVGEPDCNSAVGIGLISSKGSTFGQWIDAPPNQLRSYLCEFRVDI